MYFMNFEEASHKVKGMDKLLQFIPEASSWCYFYKIYSLYLYSDYDYEEWWEIQNLHLEMDSQDNKYRVTIRFDDVTSFYLAQSTGISGFEIECNQDHAFGSRRNFYVYDFEEGDIRFYCKEIEVEKVVEL